MLLIFHALLLKDASGAGAGARRGGEGSAGARRGGGEVAAGAQGGGAVLLLERRGVVALLERVARVGDWGVVVLAVEVDDLESFRAGAGGGARERGVLIGSI